jgi:hypothetical protein
VESFESEKSDIRVVLLFCSSILTREEQYDKEIEQKLKIKLVFSTAVHSFIPFVNLPRVYMWYKPNIQTLLSIVHASFRVIFA